MKSALHSKNIIGLLIASSTLWTSAGCAVEDVELAGDTELSNDAVVVGETSAAIDIGCFNSEYFCELDLATRALSCPYLPNPQDVSIISTTNGVVLQVNMKNWSQVQVQAEAIDSRYYAFHIGNSLSNDGWSGDANNTKYDSEAHLYENSLFVYRNDVGGSGLAGSVADAIPGRRGSFCVTVAEQEIAWYGTPAGSAQSTTYLGLSDPNIFRIGVDDYLLYLGFNRTVGLASRTGSALTGTALISLMPR